MSKGFKDYNYVYLPQPRSLKKRILSLLKGFTVYHFSMIDNTATLHECFYLEINLIEYDIRTLLLVAPDQATLEGHGFGSNPQKDFVIGNDLPTPLDSFNPNSWDNFASVQLALFGDKPTQWINYAWPVNEANWWWSILGYANASIANCVKVMKIIYYTNYKEDRPQLVSTVGQELQGKTITGLHNLEGLAPGTSEFVSGDFESGPTSEPEKYTWRDEQWWPDAYEEVQYGKLAWINEQGYVIPDELSIDKPFTNLVWKDGYICCSHPAGLRQSKFFFRRMNVCAVGPSPKLPVDKQIPVTKDLDKKKELNLLYSKTNHKYGWPPSVDISMGRNTPSDHRANWDEWTLFIDYKGDFEPVAKDLHEKLVWLDWVPFIRQLLYYAL